MFGRRENQRFVTGGMAQAVRLELTLPVLETGVLAIKLHLRGSQGLDRTSISEVKVRRPAN